MKKYMRIAFLSLAVLGLLTGSAFAAAAIGNGTGPANATVNIATEVVGQAGLSIADDGTVYYQATNSFVQNDVITFTFSNVKLYDTAFSLCKTGSAVALADYIGTTDVTNGVSTLTFRVAAAGIAAPQEVIIVGGAACIAEAPYTTATQKLSVKFPVLTATQTATVQASAVFGTGTDIPGATAAAVPLYTVVNQYTLTIPAGLKTDNIDFNSDMKKILVGGLPVVLDTGNTFTLADSGPAKAHVLATSDKMDVTISGNMAGVARICFDDAVCTAASTKLFTINASANTATRSVTFATPALGDFNGKAITFVVDGVTPLTERTFTITAVMNLNGANELDRTLLSTANYFQMALTTYQAICPFVKANAPTVETYVRLNSSYISTGSEANIVKGSVLCTNGVASVVNLGAITPGTSKLITASDVVTAAGATCVPSALATSGFPVTFSVNAPAANVSGVATMVQPEGMRAIPMKSNNSGAGTYSE